MPLNSSTSQPDGTAGSVGSTDTWLVRVTRFGVGRLLGATPVESQCRTHYITITLEYIYLGSGQAELYPNAIVLVCFDPSPLQGLARSPVLYFNENTQQTVKLDKQALGLSIEARTLHHISLVYEFHQDCREFRLYFPGREGIPVEL